MNGNRLVALFGLGVISCVSISITTRAQIYSSNIVGYINQPLFAGDNLIANQLSNSNNTLNALFPTSTPEGATFTKWDANLVQYLPLSTYDSNTGWSIDYDLTYGEGGLFHSPTTFTNTFVGGVWPGFNGIDPFNPPLVSGNGRLLLSCYIPIAATFFDVIGRAPAEGEYVETLNGLTQTESLTKFHNDAWNNGDPLLAVGQAAFFGLGPNASNVPEPATWGLLGGGLLALAKRHSLRQKNETIST